MVKVKELLESRRTERYSSKISLEFLVISGMSNHCCPMQE